MLADGRAADALTVPGVAVESGDPRGGRSAADRFGGAAARGRPEHPQRHRSGGRGTGRRRSTRVTVEYEAGGYPGTTTFEVERDGSIGLAPTWRFATSPLAVMDLVVKGSMVFDVNGFTIDKRQVSVDGVDADPLAAVPLLVFSPGLYSVSVDTAISATPGVAVLSDSPFARFPSRSRPGDGGVRRRSCRRRSRSSSPAARPRRCCSRPAARSASSCRIASRRCPQWAIAAAADRHRRAGRRRMAHPARRGRGAHHGRRPLALRRLGHHRRARTSPSSSTATSACGRTAARRSSSPAPTRTDAPPLSARRGRRARPAPPGVRCTPRARHHRCDRRAGRGASGRGRRCDSTGSPR